MHDSSCLQGGIEQCGVLGLCEDDTLLVLLLSSPVGASGDVASSLLGSISHAVRAALRSVSMALAGELAQRAHFHIPSFRCSTWLWLLYLQHT